MARPMPHVLSSEMFNGSTEVGMYDIYRVFHDFINIEVLTQLYKFLWTGKPKEIFNFCNNTKVKIMQAPWEIDVT